MNPIIEVWKYNKKSNKATKCVALIDCYLGRILRVADGYYAGRMFVSDKQLKELEKSPTPVIKL